jgi:hypothetical protein
VAKPIRRLVPARVVLVRPRRVLPVRCSLQVRLVVLVHRLDSLAVLAAVAVVAVVHLVQMVRA